MNVINEWFLMKGCSKPKIKNTKAICLKNLAKYRSYTM